MVFLDNKPPRTYTSTYTIYKPDENKQYVKKIDTESYKNSTYNYDER